MPEQKTLSDAKAFYEAVASIVGSMCGQAHYVSDSDRPNICSAIVEVGEALAKAEKKAIEIINQ